MNELLKLNENGKISARDIWEFVESKREFGNWISQRISKYCWIENKDYTVHKKMNALTQQVETIEYYCTLEMAKELAMVENNEKGHQARLYFINCEKRLKELDIGTFLIQTGEKLQNIDYLRELKKVTEKALSSNVNH